MSNNSSLYVLNHNEYASLIAMTGDKQTHLVEGDMGIGKTQLLPLVADILKDMYPERDYVQVYFDATTKDVGDLGIPEFADNVITDENGEEQTMRYLRYVINQEMGLHYGKPVVLMLDEIGKANKSVFNALLRVMQEHNVMGTPLPAGSVIFATTNLAGERVGDTIPPHGRNRITIGRLRKATVDEQIEYGLTDGWHPTVLGFIKETPDCLRSFTDYDPKDDPDENPYIYHPRSARRSFVTPRSLETLSDMMHRRDMFPDSFNDTMLASFAMGTVGQRAGAEFDTFVRLHDKLPTTQEIKDDPQGCKLADSAGAAHLVVWRALQTIDKSWVDQWATYIMRLQPESQAMFVNTVRQSKFDKRKQAAVFGNKKFKQWVVEKRHTFATDVV
jgi:hypothetical protein